MTAEQVIAVMSSKNLTLFKHKGNLKR